MNETPRCAVQVPGDRPTRLRYTTHAFLLLPRGRFGLWPGLADFAGKREEPVRLGPAVSDRWRSQQRQQQTLSPPRGQEWKVNRIRAVRGAGGGTAKNHTPHCERVSKWLHEHEQAGLKKGPVPRASWPAAPHSAPASTAFSP